MCVCERYQVGGSMSRIQVFLVCEHHSLILIETCISSHRNIIISTMYIYTLL